MQDYTPQSEKDVPGASLILGFVCMGILAFATWPWIQEQVAAANWRKAQDAQRGSSQAYGGPVCVPASGVSGEFRGIREIGGCGSGGDPTRVLRDALGRTLRLDDAAFDAADRLVNSQAGSPEFRRAEGQVVRECTKATGRLVRDGAREAKDTLTSKDFWKGLTGK